MYDMVEMYISTDIVSTSKLIVKKFVQYNSMSDVSFIFFFLLFPSHEGMKQEIYACHIVIFTGVKTDMAN